MKKFIVKVLCLLVICLIPIEVHAMKVGFVADIHAGKEKVRNRVREGNGNIVFPKFYKLWLTRVFIWMKNDGADLVISLGDNVNTKENSDANDLAKFIKKKKVDVKWAKGNHDSRISLLELYHGRNIIHLTKKGGDSLSWILQKLRMTDKEEFLMRS